MLRYLPTDCDATECLECYSQDSPLGLRRSCWDKVISLKPYLCGSDVFDLPKAELVARRLPVGLPETGFAAEE
ncbi:hypothetical protein CDL15_Pgr003947 [Punica granatum]|uniref:Uncharacterized protein n=1 Tax=Punica granatum TaxID=22663 RepID=A0A218W6C7_PUNGR|nr:hypothetical protein CDL15_Pgr003947 [Punica granatum]